MALAPNLAEIGRNCSQTCYVFIKTLSKTITTVLVTDGHSTCHALRVVTDKVKLEFNKPTLIFSPSLQQRALTFVLRSIHFQHQFVNLFLLHNADILQREASKALLDTKHSSTNSHLPTVYFPGRDQKFLKGNYQQLKGLVLVIVTQQHFLVTSRGHFQTKLDRSKAYFTLLITTGFCTILFS